MLETAPSFDIYSKDVANDGVEVELPEDEKKKIDASVEGSSDFSFVKPSMDLIKEEDGVVDGEVEEEKLGSTEEEEEQEIDPLNTHSMYLAAGLGLGTSEETALDFGDMEDVSQETCRELLEQYPNHPPLLRKYAELLQGNGDLQAAEEYYFKAAQANPGNGEILIQYAQLVWELHHDQERALTYFELAAQTAPKNTNVLAAVAKFLWETEDGEHKSEHPESVQEKYPQISDMGGPNESADIGSYYKRMIEQNPSDPFFLKKYAQLLYQSKGDLQGAEEYYSRAILADPKDGEILSQFATLLWELYHDQDRTLSYLERAIQAAPQDSDVLAAYARILWTIDEE